MVKYFCDLCGDEIVKTNSMPTVLVGKKSSKMHGTGLVTLYARIEVGDKDGVACADHIFCKYCVLSAVASLDDRDKAVCEERGR